MSRRDQNVLCRTVGAITVPEYLFLGEGHEASFQAASELAGASIPGADCAVHSTGRDLLTLRTHLQGDDLAVAREGRFMLAPDAQRLPRAGVPSAQGSIDSGGD